MQSFHQIIHLLNLPIKEESHFNFKTATYDRIFQNQVLESYCD